MKMNINRGEEHQATASAEFCGDQEIPRYLLAGS